MVVRVRANGMVFFCECVRFQGSVAIRADSRRWKEQLHRHRRRERIPRGRSRTPSFFFWNGGWEIGFGESPIGNGDNVLQIHFVTSQDFLARCMETRRRPMPISYAFVHVEQGTNVRSILPSWMARSTAWNDFSTARPTWRKPSHCSKWSFLLIPYGPDGLTGYRTSLRRLDAPSGHRPMRVTTKSGS